MTTSKLYPRFSKHPALLGFLLSALAGSRALQGQTPALKEPPRKEYKEEDPGCVEVRAILKEFILADPSKADLTVIRFMRSHPGCGCSLAKAALTALPKKENGRPNTPMLASMLKAIVEEIYRALPGCKPEVKAIVLTAVNALRTGTNIDPSDFRQLRALIAGKAARTAPSDSKMVFEPARDSKTVIEPERDYKVVFEPLRDDDPLGAIYYNLGDIDLADVRELLGGAGGIILNDQPSLLDPIMRTIGFTPGGTIGKPGRSGNNGGVFDNGGDPAPPQPPTP